MAVTASTLPGEPTSTPRPVARNGPGLERVAEVQRARMLAAMTELVRERGLAGATVARVVAKAGVSRRTFYELFEDRQECYLAALDDAVERVSACIDAAYDPEASWVDRVRSTLIALLGFLEAEQSAGWLLVAGSLGGGVESLERRSRLTGRMIALVDQGRNESKPAVEPSPLTAEGIVGGVLSILHARMLACPPSSTADGESMLALAGPLMSTIVMPYLGAATARRELKRPATSPPLAASALQSDPLCNLDMRLTYRTIRVLTAVAAIPGGSNRQVADAAGISDQGQISKLLARLERVGLIENVESSPARGAPNAWTLTPQGWRVQSVTAPPPAAPRL